MKNPHLYDIQPHEFKYHVVLLGDTGVGKTTFAENLKGRPFSHQHEATIGVQYSNINIEPLSLPNARVVAETWDIAGSDQSQNIIDLSSYLSQTHACILICDLNNTKSFIHLKSWINTIKEHNEQIPIVLVGTKADLERKVTEEKLKKLASDNSLIMAEPSVIDLHVQGTAQKVITHTIQHIPKFKEEYDSVHIDLQVAKNRAIQILESYKNRRNSDWFGASKGAYSKSEKIAAAQAIIDFIQQFGKPSSQKPPAAPLEKYAAAITQKGFFGDKRLRVAYTKASQLLLNGLPSLEYLEQTTKSIRAK